MKPKLSISILISNRSEYVQKCLESVGHLMETIPCELILTDTGVNAEVRALMEEYTNHIIEFDWIKDFSAARNVGLAESSGEWFMYLDDDEWFEDTSAIENFFSSGESDNYNVAFYVQRNYLSFEGDAYVDHNVDRIIKRTQGLHFEHRIHEAYCGIEICAKKFLGDYVHHYGYVYASDDERKQKHIRNQELLDMEIKAYPENMRMQHQAVINHFEYGDWDGAIQQAKQALRVRSDSEYWDALHTDILYCLERKGDYEGVVDEGKKCLRDELYPYDSLGTLQYMLSAYWSLGRENLSNGVALEACKLFAESKRTPEKFNLQQLMRQEFFDEYRIIKMLAYASATCLITGDKILLNALLVPELKNDMHKMLQNDIFGVWLQGIFKAVKGVPGREEYIRKILGGEEQMNEVVFVYELTKICDIVTETIQCFRQQYLGRGWESEKRFITILQNKMDVIAQYSEENVAIGMAIEMLYNAIEQRDEILLADILEGKTLPFLQCVIQKLQEKMTTDIFDFLDENIKALSEVSEMEVLSCLENLAIPEDYKCNVEFTASGHPTIVLRDNAGTYYLSGNNNPRADAWLYAHGNTEDEVYRYIIFGAGLFYEAEAILSQRVDAEVVVVEEDVYLLSVALMCRDVSNMIRERRLKLVCKSYEEFLKGMGPDEKILIRKPTMKHLAGTDKHVVLNQFFLKTMAISEQRGELERNFRKIVERERDIQSVDVCQNMFKKKKVYLVAGGPSLDESLGVLEKREQDSIVFCVGTSVHKLVMHGLLPDVVIIIDSSEEVYNQIRDIFNYAETKLCYMMTSNYKAVSAFSGSKYAVCQKGFDMSEKYANENGYTLFCTGGSVSTTALDICIRFGCAEVVCLGLDLGYTENRTHASETMQENSITNTTDMIQVENVEGKKIYTSYTLDSYRKWIERRLEEDDACGIRFVNISNGAFIEGMKNVLIKDI